MCSHHSLKLTQKLINRYGLIFPLRSLFGCSVGIKGWRAGSRFCPRLARRGHVSEDQPTRPFSPRGCSPRSGAYVPMHVSHPMTWAQGSGRSRAGVRRVASNRCSGWTQWPLCPCVVSHRHEDPTCSRPRGKGLVGLVRPQRGAALGRSGTVRFQWRWRVFRASRRCS